MQLFDSNWNFKEVVDRIEYIRDQYEEILGSFLYYEIKERNEFMRSIKKQVYSLKFEEYKRDRIWNYLHRDDFLFILKEIVNRQK